jgi:hypothetical protein
MPRYQFAFAVIVNGGRFHQLQQVRVVCHGTPPKEWNFERTQKIIDAAVFDLAHGSCGSIRTGVVRMDDRFSIGLPELNFAPNGKWTISIRDVIVPINLARPESESTT